MGGLGGLAGVGRSLAKSEMPPVYGSVLWCRGAVVGVLSGWSLCQAAVQGGLISGEWDVGSSVLCALGSWCGAKRESAAVHWTTMSTRTVALAGR